MKVLVILALMAFAAYQVTDARMSAFACHPDCFTYLEGPFCISNGSVVCDNCIRDRMLCDDSNLRSVECKQPCDK
nr:schistosomin-like peptide [Haliotis discus hannai]